MDTNDVERQLRKIGERDAARKQHRERQIKRQEHRRPMVWGYGNPDAKSNRRGK